MQSTPRPGRGLRMAGSLADRRRAPMFLIGIAVAIVLIVVFSNGSGSNSTDIQSLTGTYYISVTGGGNPEVAETWRRLGSSGPPPAGRVAVVEVIADVAGSGTCQAVLQLRHPDDWQPIATEFANFAVDTSATTVAALKNADPLLVEADPARPGAEKVRGTAIAMPLPGKRLVQHVTAMFTVPDTAAADAFVVRRSIICDGATDVVRDLSKGGAVYGN